MAEYVERNDTREKLTDVEQEAILHAQGDTEVICEMEWCEMMR